MPFALNHTKAILEDLGILRRICNKDLVRQFGRETMLVVRVLIGIGGVARTAFQSMLANHDRTFFAGLDSFRDVQDAVSEYSGPDVEDHLVAAKLRLVV